MIYLIINSQYGIVQPWKDLSYIDLRVYAINCTNYGDIQMDLLKHFWNPT